ncbi:hypothetical protein [Vibrio alginolyticus]|uniref:hypothetical protein n=1 Tax=Vibrio alginolyticus TaxID=663 RepID=UPI00215D5D0F|nr:hypothetical protein [Vibrio alginolyticus]MCR9514099.1 hypothetical protein [Vibrio alginolyticus]
MNKFRVSILVIAALILTVFSVLGKIDVIVIVSVCSGAVLILSFVDGLTESFGATKSKRKRNC